MPASSIWRVQFELRRDNLQLLIRSVPSRVRAVAALETCVALVLAFAMAPFEHVHSGDAKDHDHPAIIHTHFFEFHAPHQTHSGPGFDDPDDDHASAWQSNSFTIVVPAAGVPFVPSRSPGIRVALTEVPEPVIAVEERAHDPPAIALPTPRPPPADLS
jgi:hypothetical protein